MERLAQTAAPESQDPLVATNAVQEQLRRGFGDRYRARELAYGFVDGRLASVRFRSSVDGFAFVTAAMKQAYGEPAAITRDDIRLANGFSMPHVALRWKTAHGQALPAADGGHHHDQHRQVVRYGVSVSARHGGDGYQSRLLRPSERPGVLELRDR